ncbi:unnamed protein product [Psylliodes chrysocephalus]|uniref:Attacin C-terminal domain-containing protein n=1 Tax=Psylliodes chrysocephalus TaxID=3402493 RepID=A0A9P0GAN6_9CUCU|nr:unnamed protein product [Psylliodes chrysocephala]
MKFFIVIISFVAYSTAVPVDIAFLEEKQFNELNTKWGLNQDGYGASHTGNIYDNGRNVLDGTVSASKAWHSHGLEPDVVGGRLEFSNKPSGSTAFVGADRTRGLGTDVNAGVKYNLVQDKNLNVDVSGQYERHFGGPGGTGKPDAGQSLKLLSNKNIFKIKLFIFVIISFVAYSTALPIDGAVDEEEYLLVPVHRERRQTKWGLNQSGYGASHTGNIYNNGRNGVTGTVSASKAWNSHGLKPDVVGGRLDFTNKPTGSGAFIGADRTRGFGTDVNAGAKYNFLQKKNWSGDVSGQYGRHFGGPGGTGKPNAGVFLNVNGRF